MCRHLRACLKTFCIRGIVTNLVHFAPLLIVFKSKAKVSQRDLGEIFSMQKKPNPYSLSGYLFFEVKTAFGHFKSMSLTIDIVSLNSFSKI